MLNGGIVGYFRQKVPNWFYSGAAVESVVRVLRRVFAEAAHRGVNYHPLEELVVGCAGVFCTACPLLQGFWKFLQALLSV